MPLPRKEFARQSSAHRQPVLSPMTTALVLAHQGISSPENSAKMMAQLNALDTKSKR